MAGKKKNWKRIIAFLMALLLMMQIVEDNTLIGSAQNDNVSQEVTDPIQPTIEPTEVPTIEPTESPTAEPTEVPTEEPTETPTVEPTAPVSVSTFTPTPASTATPTESPTPNDFEVEEDHAFNIMLYSEEPAETPTAKPTENPADEPVNAAAAAITIQGTVSYSGDTDWKALIRPDTFSGKIQLTAYNADGEEIKTFETTTDPGGECYLGFVHDGNGGGDYTIVNIPVSIDVNGSPQTVSKYRVAIAKEGGYDTAEATAEGITADRTVFTINLVRRPVTAAITVKKELLGAGEETEISFPIKISASSEGKNANKTINVSSGGEGTIITVPAGFTYKLEETPKEGYSFLYYKIGENVSDTCNIEAEEGGNYSVTVVNASHNQKMEWKVNWVDNHRFSGRPKPVFELQFKTDDYTEFRTVTEYNLSILGLDEVPVAQKAETDLVQQDTENYYFENLPSVTVDGKAITYRVTADETADYLIKWSEDRSVVTYTAASSFSVIMKWSDLSEQSMRPDIENVEELLNLNLYRYTHEYYEKVTLNDGLAIEENEDGKSWSISANELLPKYADDNESLTYVLVQGTIEEDGTVTPYPLPGYQTTYDNGTGSFGNVTDRCYNGQTIIQTLTDTTDFKATKKWNDGTGDERPAATVTLWRYSMRDENDTQIDMSRSARVIVQGKTGDVLMSYQLTTSNVKNDGSNLEEQIDFLEHFKDQLNDGYEFPKYDELGREYRYFVQEILEEKAGSQYKTVYMTGDNETVNGAFDGGTIWNTKVDQLAIKVYKKWNAASALSDLEGKEITFALVGKDSEGNIVEIPIQKGTATVSGFGKEQTTASTEFLVNPYDENGQLYTILGIKEKDITGIEEGSLSFDESNPTRVTFKIGENIYTGTCQKTGEGISALYDAKQVTYQVMNSISQYKEYTIEKRWETGKEFFI